jgi:hypothetical protein
MSIQSPLARDAETVAPSSRSVDIQKRIASLYRWIRPRMLPLFRRSPGIAIAGSMAVLFAAAYLIAAPMGRDLSAQLAHAELAESHWPALLDLRWYGGFNPLGYSVLSPPVMALLGVRLTTAVAYVASVILFAALLKEARVVRPVAGSIMAAICLAGNLVTTRTTFALGLALGLGALVALVAGRLRVTSVLCVLAALCSPVAGLFLAVAGFALVLSGRWRNGVIITLTALAPTVAMELAFGNGGRQSFGLQHAVLSFLICLLVAGLGWRRSVIRWGALLSAGMVAAAYLLPTPVGTTAARLPELFAAPVIVAIATVPFLGVVAATVAAVVLVPPVSLTEIQERDDPALKAEFYGPLLDQLAARKAVGPIEVVPTLRRGEAAVVAPSVAIAKGWSRPPDIQRNPIFYDGTLNADTYRKWLNDNAISYVAVSKGPYDWAAADEAALVRRGFLWYLKPVWWDETWTLYEVKYPRAVIQPPGQVVARDATSLQLSLPSPGQYVLRVRWSRYLSASTGCVRPTKGGWSVVVVDEPGTVTIEGSLKPRQC